MATASQDCNALLKLKFKGLHAKVVGSVNAASIIDVLFQGGILGADDMRSLQRQTDQQQQCRELLALLYTSENPKAFVKLYSAIKNEAYLDWLAEEIDKYSTVGQLVHALAEDLPVWGLTSLAGNIYLWRDKEREQVEVYDASTYRIWDYLTVPGVRGITDMASCKHYLCVYIGDPVTQCVHRLDIRSQGAATRWAVNDEPQGLSVNAAHSVIVTCRTARKIKVFSLHGECLSDVSLPDGVINPWHAIQTSSGLFILCHGNHGDQLHRVCMMTADGHHIVHSHGENWGRATGEYNVPRHLAVNDNELVFVDDIFNRRVKLLSPTLEYVGEAVSRDQLTWRPCRVCLDTERRLLYVADNEWKDGSWTTGRVVVFSV